MVSIPVVVPMGDGKLCTSSESKILYQSIINFDGMIASVRWRKLPDLVEIGWIVATPRPREGEIYTFHSIGFHFFFLSLFRQLAYRPQLATDVGAY